MDVDKLVEEAKEGKIEETLQDSGVIRIPDSQIVPEKNQTTAIEKLGDDVAELVARWKLEEELSYSKIMERLKQQGHDVTIGEVQAFFVKYNKIKDKILEDNTVLRRRLIRRTLVHEHNLDNMIQSLIDQLDIIKSAQDIDEVERTQALTSLIKTALDAMRSDSTILSATRNEVKEKITGITNLTQINITNKIGKEKENLRAELLRADFSRVPSHNIIETKSQPIIEVVTNEEETEVDDENKE